MSSQQVITHYTWPNTTVCGWSASLRTVTDNGSVHQTGVTHRPSERNAGLALQDHLDREFERTGNPEYQVQVADLEWVRK